MWIIILVVILVLLVLGLPTWPYSQSWGLGYGPTGVLGTILIVVIILLLLGKL